METLRTKPNLQEDGTRGEGVNEQARQVGALPFQMRVSGQLKPMTRSSMEAGRGRCVTMSLVSLTASLPKQRLVEAVAPEGNSHASPSSVLFDQEAPRSLKSCCLPL